MYKSTAHRFVLLNMSIGNMSTYWRYELSIGDMCDMLTFNGAPFECIRMYDHMYDV